MSITGLSGSNKPYKKPVHQRNDSSGELDVFEASRYFSGHATGETFRHKFVREGRVSIDMPITRNSIPFPSDTQVMMNEKQTKEKKYKQPSSPSGRLASFLNSLFHQTTKKKKSKSTTTTTTTITKGYEEESPGGRRKRRSSISLFRSGSNTDSKSFYSSSSSGFRTPPPCKDLRSYSDHKQVIISLPTHNIGHAKPTISTSQNDAEFNFSSGFQEKLKNCDGCLEKDRIWGDKYQPHEEKEFRKFGHEVDEGGDSDSSSDLFELENYDLGCYSSGLPVYETTHMDTIKRGAPISNGTM